MDTERKEVRGEIFYRDSRGALIHDLAGERRWETRTVEPIYHYNRKKSMFLPVGASMPSDFNGEIRGGFCLLHCRLTLPHRFVFRHETLLSEGKTEEEILSGILRDGFGKTLARCAENLTPATGFMEQQVLWERIRTSLWEALLEEGWKMEEFRPGTIRFKGA